MLNILLLSLGLAMDSFGASIALGSRVNKKNLLSTGVLNSSIFGFFQAGMPLIGIYIGTVWLSYVAHIDHWIAFFLLSAVGIKSVLDGFEAPSVEVRTKPRKRLIVYLAFATSIDALVVGLGLVSMGSSVLFTIATIGLVTFILTMLGLYLGAGNCNFFKDKASIIGGLILIGIGIKIVLDHHIS